MLDSLSTLAGPAAASVILATSGVSVVFAVCAALSLLGGIVVVALQVGSTASVIAGSRRARSD